MHIGHYIIRLVFANKTIILNRNPRSFMNFNHCMSRLLIIRCSRIQWAGSPGPWPHIKNMSKLCVTSCCIDFHSFHVHFLHLTNLWIKLLKASIVFDLNSSTILLYQLFIAKMLVHIWFSAAKCLNGQQKINSHRICTHFVPSAVFFFRFADCDLPEKFIPHFLLLAYSFLNLCDYTVIIHYKWKFTLKNLW